MDCEWIVGVTFSLTGLVVVVSMLAIGEALLSGVIAVLQLVPRLGAVTTRTCAADPARFERATQV